MILDPILAADAVVIPDNFRMVHHFVKLFKYHGVEQLPLLGNHEWRSMGLVEPWEPFLNGAVFADFIGSYFRIPAGIEYELGQNQFFVREGQTVAVDFQLIGYRAGAIGLEVLSFPLVKRRHLVKHLLKQRQNRATLPPTRCSMPRAGSRWPTFLFRVAGKKIDLISNH